MRKRFGRLVSSTLSIGFLTLSTGGCANRGMVAPDTTTVVDCTVVRQECIAETLGANGPQCMTFATPPPPVVGTVCATDGSQSTMDAACAVFCNAATSNPQANYPYPMPCTSTGTLNPNNLPVVGTCHPLGKSTAGRASVAFQVHQHRCPEGVGSVCNSITDDSHANPAPPGNCYDLTTASAVDAVKPNPLDRDGVMHITKILASDPECATETAALIAYDLTPGPLGRATGSGMTVPFSLTRGSAAFSGGQLSALSINVADLAVSGTQLSNVLVTNSVPATLEIGDPDNPSHTGIAAGNLQLQVIGLAAGVPQIYHLVNDTDLDMILSNTTLNLSGTFSFKDVDPNGKPLPISVTFTMPGTPSTPATKACSTASPRDRLFGFEDPQSWSSTVAALSLVTSPVTQGCGALGIQGQGYMPINSVPFVAAGLALNSAVSVDLFIPNNQPNQSYLGALQMYLTCPSVNAFNEYIGQVELTGKPQNAYSTLRFPLPSQVSSTLRQGASDCSWGFALNANPTNRTWILDNLRFTN
jgi:hypothetical protein